jgi:hypothetical protein
MCQVLFARHAAGYCCEMDASGKVEKRKTELKKDEMLVVISCLSIVRDEVIVVIFTRREGDQLYKFQYYYQPDTRDYKLIRVDRGMSL